MKHYILDEMKRALYGVESSDEIFHYGRSKMDGAPGRGSGRYALGSGEDPNQHRGNFLSRVKELRGQGLNDHEVAAAVGLKNASELRKQYAIAYQEDRANRISTARAMLADGKKQADVARELGINESTLRSLLNQKSEVKTKAAAVTRDFLKEQVDTKGMIDVGLGVEKELGISREKLEQACSMLEDEGYHIYGGRVPQVNNPGKETIIKVLTTPEHEHKDIYNYGDIKTVHEYKARTDENGNEVIDVGFKYPESLDSKRLMIRYRDDVAPDGHTGIEKDGTVEIRPGVRDLSLGEGNNYAQVRILVDGKNYIKGMAFYNEDMPDGVDVIFNTNKMPGQDVLKPIKDDPQNPFGALLREKGGQVTYTDPETGETRLGLINKTKIEGDWNDWGKTLPSQFLSKQPQKLIDTQLELSIADKQAEFDEIMSVTNPTVRKQLLKDFAQGCDKQAEDLDASPLPRAGYQVLLPVATMKDNEVYAPNFHDGETVALVRFPHGGLFEIPILTVNNKQADARKIMGDDPKDAIGINSKVAERLSGADFDGDAVLVIPCNSNFSKVHIENAAPLKGLEGFDPKMQYGTTMKLNANNEKEYYNANGKKITPMTRTNLQMGIISNLITDMTIKGASQEELARAVRHSMVVIDAEKHHLDWQQSEIDNGILALKKYYQPHYDPVLDQDKGGASTLLSIAKNEVSIDRRQGQPNINQIGKPWYDASKPEGALIYKSKHETFIGKDGKEHVRQEKATHMSLVDDANLLSSGRPQEQAYARYANWLKNKANEARKEMVYTEEIKYDKKANAVYAEEVRHLTDELKTAELNKPRERQAQLAARSQLNAIERANPNITPKEKMKKATQLIAMFRAKFGAKRHPIEITPRDWEAIMAGALHVDTLKRILQYADGTQVRQYSMPKKTNHVTTGQQARIKAMKNSGYTALEIAEALGLPKSTVRYYIDGEGA